jgi:hypothetical protein
MRRFSGNCRAATALLPACITVSALCFALTSCARKDADTISERQPAIGVAYAGPATMSLRKDLAAKSPGVVEVKHGERLDIIEARRKLVRVRTVAGVEGWVDANLLLTAQEMDNLKQLAEKSKNLPVQGKATVFDALNVHTDPSRFSPSFAQIPEGGSVEVLTHRATPRVSAKPKVIVQPPARVPVRAKKGKAAKTTALLISPPPAPALPKNWEKMSRPRVSDLPGYEPPAPPPPPPLDDWDLVRTSDGKVGWVLARNLYMSIPDEVAQYAEGNRITAYMPLGEVTDGDQVKKNWVWTTATSSLKEAEFDSFRVFVWSLRRHRYETAFVERNVTGYYPLESVEIPGGQEKGFSVLVRDKDGMVYKRVYAFGGYRVRLVSKAPAQVPAVPFESEAKMRAQAAPPAPESGWRSRLTALARQWFKR